MQTRIIATKGDSAQIALSPVDPAIGTKQNRIAKVVTKSTNNSLKNRV